ncbi:b13.1 [Ichnoviriform fugitivi]|uniref:B13.1 n=1 Tax=Ichnoviriform fugitivi TaxID=265522 RepID=A2Q0E6_9VIRU|nr:b13.1 [Ichnoviriform fugitivi]BAF45661.1 b13.1 [Ichnoviriform fugitivi]
MPPMVLHPQHNMLRMTDSELRAYQRPASLAHQWPASLVTETPATLSNAVYVLARLQNLTDYRHYGMSIKNLTVSIHQYRTKVSIEINRGKSRAEQVGMPRHLHVHSRKELRR